MFEALILLLLCSAVAFSQSGHPSTVCVEESACYLGSWYYRIPTSTLFASFQGIRYAQPPIGTLRY